MSKVVTSENNNTDWFVNDFLGGNTTRTILSYCSSSLQLTEHWMFQLANVIFFISFALPSTKICTILMHSLLLLGFTLFSTWSWQVMCATDMFSWNVLFLCLSFLHMTHLIYQIRPIHFYPELEETYQTLFKPFKVKRLQFKKLVSEPFAQIMALHAGEAYAMQNLTRTDRLALLLTGKVNALQDNQMLHPIMPGEFLDSPEFESRVHEDDKFKVSLIAAVQCRYLYWQRSSLEYLFIKDSYLATVISTLVAADITNKLYLMNNKIITDKGNHLDIRLPSITAALAAAAAKSRGEDNIDNPGGNNSGDEQLWSAGEAEDWQSSSVGPISELETLTEMRYDAPGGSLSAASGIIGGDCWLDTNSNSKYHSCELLDT